jgi:hypothetical protein
VTFSSVTLFGSVPVFSGLLLIRTRGYLNVVVNQSHSGHSLKIRKRLVVVGESAHFLPLCQRKVRLTFQDEEVRGQTGSELLQLSLVLSIGCQPSSPGSLETLPGRFNCLKRVPHIDLNILDELTLTCVELSHFSL